jgi:predicted acyltransferase
MERILVECASTSMSTPTTVPPSPVVAVSQRLVSLDAYRGFVMFLMAAEVMHLMDIAKYYPRVCYLSALRFNTTHVAWTGCSLHDMIQPSFSFMVGVALPYSLASRASRGASRWAMALHALWRSVILVLLGVFLRSIGQDQTTWTFEDTLTQIGLGYPFLFLLGFAGTRVRWAAFAAILIGYWAYFAQYPLPPANFTAVTPPGWSNQLTGFAAHWNINANPAWAFDTWFLNLFPRSTPFLGSMGGYSTLSFIPTLATMLLGLIVGQWLKDSPPAGTMVKRLLKAMVILAALGLLLHFTGVCPVVKKIWTPAWVLVSGGLCCGIMALFYGIIDVAGLRRWAFPLVVIGMNSIAMYVMAHTIQDFIGESLYTHVGKAPFLALGPNFEPVLHGASVLLILWLILLWMYRRKIFLRV